MRPGRDFEADSQLLVVQFDEALFAGGDARKRIVEGTSTLDALDQGSAPEDGLGLLPFGVRQGYLRRGAGNLGEPTAEGGGAEVVLMKDGWIAGQEGEAFGRPFAMRDVGEGDEGVLAEAIAKRRLAIEVPECRPHLRFGLRVGLLVLLVPIDHLPGMAIQAQHMSSFEILHLDDEQPELAMQDQNIGLMAVAPSGLEEGVPEEA
ncbi:hypothetical protein D3C87_1127400 [compost metagenome]